MTSLLLSLLLPLFPALPAAGGCPAGATLGVRNAHAMAYDAVRGVVVLFGGADERRVLGDLWAWDGEGWRCLAAGGPPPRTFPALADDPVAGRLLLFGGNRVLFGKPEDTDTFLDDMWAWDGRAWRRLPGPTPSARAEAGMVYDSARRRVVLFGGYRTGGGERVRLGDTWEWDGSRWELRSTEGPTPRNGAALAYDARRRRVVLFGGSGAPEETWEWDGRSWERIDPARAEGRFNSAMAYDAERGTVVRFGGWTRAGRVGGTWLYDGAGWTKVAGDGPTPRNHTAMAYDARRRVLVLFGGHDGERVFGDTWEWDGRGWSRRTAEGPRRRVDNGH